MIIKSAVNKYIQRYDRGQGWYQKRELDESYCYNRANDLPAYIMNNGDQYWIFNGDQIRRMIKGELLGN